MVVQQFRWIASVALMLSTASHAAVDSKSLPVTPRQVQYLEDARQAAMAASSIAEQEMLEMFGTAQFRLGLIEDGAWELAKLHPAELMAQFKRALGGLEYTSNWGVDDDWRKDHPGAPAMGLPTITRYGYIPNMWELRAVNSTLAAGIPMEQWEILEAAETGIYHLPLSGESLPVGPNKQQAKERIQYISANFRMQDIGVARYGAYAAVLRNSVIKDRAIIVGSDTGGWENACNKSVKPIQKWFPIIGSAVARCDGLYADAPKGKGQPALATSEYQMHAIKGNTKIFGKVGGHLSRLVYQFLHPGAKVRPLETLMYTEAGLLGPLRPQDMKLMVASFPGLFGTPEAVSLRLYCRAHRLPLAWAINGGMTWNAASQLKMEFLPFGPIELPVGPDRLLDPYSWQWTNASMPINATEIFKEVAAEVVQARKAKLNLTKTKFTGWWNRITAISTGLHPIRMGYCEASDLCFGTFTTNKGEADCVCRSQKSLQPTELPSDLLEQLDKREAGNDADGVDPNNLLVVV